MTDNNNNDDDDFAARQRAARERLEAFEQAQKEKARLKEEEKLQKYYEGIALKQQEFQSSALLDPNEFTTTNEPSPSLPRTEENSIQEEEEESTDVSSSQKKKTEAEKRAEQEALQARLDQEDADRWAKLKSVAEQKEQARLERERARERAKEQQRLEQQRFAEEQIRNSQKQMEELVKMAQEQQQRLMSLHTSHKKPQEQEAPPSHHDIQIKDKPKRTSSSVRHQKQGELLTDDSEPEQNQHPNNTVPNTDPSNNHDEYQQRLAEAMRDVSDHDEEFQKFDSSHGKRYRDNYVRAQSSRADGWDLDLTDCNTAEERATAIDAYKQQLAQKGVEEIPIDLFQDLDEFQKFDSNHGKRHGSKYVKVRNSKSERDWDVDIDLSQNSTAAEREAALAAYKKQMATNSGGNLEAIEESQPRKSSQRESKYIHQTKDRLPDMDWQDPVAIATELELQKDIKEKRKSLPTLNDDNDSEIRAMDGSSNNLDASKSSSKRKSTKRTGKRPQLRRQRSSSLGAMDRNKDPRRVKSGPTPHASYNWTAPDFDWSSFQQAGADKRKSKQAERRNTAISTNANATGKSPSRSRRASTMTSSSSRPKRGVARQRSSSLTDMKRGKDKNRGRSRDTSTSRSPSPSKNEKSKRKSEAPKRGLTRQRSSSLSELRTERRGRRRSKSKESPSSSPSPNNKKEKDNKKKDAKNSRSPSAKPKRGVTRQRSSSLSESRPGKSRDRSKSVSVRGRRKSAMPSEDRERSQSVQGRSTTRNTIKGGIGRSKTMDDDSSRAMQDGNTRLQRRSSAKEDRSTKDRSIRSGRRSSTTTKDEKSKDKENKKGKDKSPSRRRGLTRQRSSSLSELRPTRSRDPSLSRRKSRTIINAGDEEQPHNAFYDWINHSKDAISRLESKKKDLEERRKHKKQQRKDKAADNNETLEQMAKEYEAKMAQLKDSLQQEHSQQLENIKMELFGQVSELKGALADQERERKEEEAKRAEEEARRIKEAKRAEEVARKAQEEAKKAREQAKRAQQEAKRAGEEAKRAEEARQAEMETRKAGEKAREEARLAEVEAKKAEEEARKAEEESLRAQKATENDSGGTGVASVSSGVTAVGDDSASINPSGKDTRSVASNDKLAGTDPAKSIDDKKLTATVSAAKAKQQQAPSQSRKASIASPKNAPAANKKLPPRIKAAQTNSGDKTPSIPSRTPSMPLRKGVSGASTDRTVSTDDSSSTLDLSDELNAPGHDTTIHVPGVPSDEELFEAGWAKHWDANRKHYYYYPIDGRPITTWYNPLENEDVGNNGKDSTSTSDKLHNNGKGSTSTSDKSSKPKSPPPKSPIRKPNQQTSKTTGPNKKTSAVEDPLPKKQSVKSTSPSKLMDTASERGTRTSRRSGRPMGNASERSTRTSRKGEANLLGNASERSNRTSRKGANPMDNASERSSSRKRASLFSKVPSRQMNDTSERSDSSTRQRGSILTKVAKKTKGLLGGRGSALGEELEAQKDAEHNVLDVKVDSKLAEKHNEDGKKKALKAMDVDIPSPTSRKKPPVEKKSNAGEGKDKGVRGRAPPKASVAELVPKRQVTRQRSSSLSDAVRGKIRDGLQPKKRAQQSMPAYAPKVATLNSEDDYQDSPLRELDTYEDELTLQQLRAKIAKLEKQLEDIEAGEAKEVDEVVQSGRAMYEKISKKAAQMSGLPDDLSELDTVLEKNNEIVKYLKAENQKRRDENQAIKKNFFDLHQNTLHFEKATEETLGYLEKLEDVYYQGELDKRQRLLGTITACKGAGEEMSEELEKRTRYVDCEKRLRRLYETSMAKILVKCEKAKEDEDLLGFLCAVSMGRYDDSIVERTRGEDEGEGIVAEGDTEKASQSEIVETSNIVAGNKGGQEKFGAIGKVTVLHTPDGNEEVGMEAVGEPATESADPDSKVVVEEETEPLQELEGQLSSPTTK